MQLSRNSTNLLRAINLNSTDIPYYIIYGQILNETKNYLI